MSRHQILMIRIQNREQNTTMYRIFCDTEWANKGNVANIVIIVVVVYRSSDNKNNILLISEPTK